jgi:hypothetical protein
MTRIILAFMLAFAGTIGRETGHGAHAGGRNTRLAVVATATVAATIPATLPLPADALSVRTGEQLPYSSRPLETPIARRAPAPYP